MNLIVVIILFGLMQAIRSFGDLSVASSVGISLALGYLLLTGYYVGRIFANLRLPKLTGYIVTGIVVGPSALGLVDSGMVDGLSLVNGMAVSLIALTAGTELNLRKMRPLFRSIRWITITGVLGTVALLMAAIFVARPLLPFLEGMSFTQTLAVSAVLGVVMVAQSPAVVVALKNELAAEGPVSQTVLGIVVIADLVVILLFAAASSIAKAVLGSGADVLSTVGILAWEIIGSLVIGGAIGYVMFLYLDKVRAGAPLFLIAVMFVIAEVGQRLHLDPLLVALSAGILIRNATVFGEDVHKHIESSSLPVYILFFAVAGTMVHLDLLAIVGLPATIFVFVRAFGLFYGTRIGATWAQADERVIRFAGFGLLPQAGLAIALATLFAKTFPEFGAAASSLVLSVVAINEIVAPALYRHALVRCGEVGQRMIPTLSLDIDEENTEEVTIA
jgi:Kef-type K+ transport system membrane component KefB